MKSKKMTRRILQYVAGLVCMAIGLVLVKRTYWGVSPITAVPDAVANITPLSLGNATILLHVLVAVTAFLFVLDFSVKKPNWLRLLGLEKKVPHE